MKGSGEKGGVGGRERTKMILITVNEMFLNNIPHPLSFSLIVVVV